MIDTVKAKELRLQLASLTDQLLLLKESPVWQQVATSEPFLETLHKQAVDATEYLWWRWRQSTAGTEPEVVDLQAIETVKDCPF